MLVAVLNADWARQPDKASAISGLRSGRKRGKLAAFRDGSTRLAQKRFLGHDLCHDSACAGANKKRPPEQSGGLFFAASPCELPRVRLSRSTWVHAR